MKERLLEDMPFDKVFDTDEGEKLCHATGVAVNFGDGEWWNEYEDEKGNLYYGR